MSRQLFGMCSSSSFSTRLSRHFTSYTKIVIKSQALLWGSPHFLFWLFFPKKSHSTLSAVDLFLCNDYNKQKARMPDFHSYSDYQLRILLERSLVS